MSTPARELVASINGVTVGRLRDEADIWSFEYDIAWTKSADGFDLAPGIPRAQGRIVDGGSMRPVQWFFDNLLPEEEARDVLARDADLTSADAFGLLEYYGKESAGAITLLPPEASFAESGYRPLSDAELHERIQNLPRQSLEAKAPKHMSNAGAQHKLAVCIREGALFEPVGATPSTHILKPDHQDTDHWPNTVANEYFVMRLAGRLGIDVPSVEIRYVPDSIYLIERFDRVNVGDETRRTHIIDSCQLLGVSRALKFQQASSENLVRCVELCTARARARINVVRWIFFNVLTGNGDAHLKNLSFRVTPEGIDLAPFYDLVSTESYRAAPDANPRWPDRSLSMPIGNAETFGTVTREDCLRAADALGVSKHAALRLLGDLTASIEGAAEALHREFDGMAIPQNTRAGQQRVLLNIRYVVIRDMVARLRSNPVRP
jgi:serine/threonine-protein kinase HipA